MKQHSVFYTTQYIPKLESVLKRREFRSWFKYWEEVSQ